LQTILDTGWGRGEGWQRAARPPEVRAYHRDSPRRAPRPTRAPTPLTLDSIAQEKKVIRYRGGSRLSPRGLSRNLPLTAGALT